MGGSKKYVLHKTNMHNVGNPIKKPTILDRIYCDFRDGFKVFLRGFTQSFLLQHHDILVAVIFAHPISFR